MENKAEQFLQRYREIEEWVQNNLKVLEMKDLETMNQYRSIRSNLSFCRYLRNLLSHHDWQKGGDDLIIVTDTALKQVNSLYYALNPVTLMRLAVKSSNIFFARLQDSVLNTISVMNRNDYSYVPIVENQTVTGVFSAKVILHYLADNPNVTISDKLLFENIAPYISTNADELKKYDFVSVDASVEDVILKFQNVRNRKKRLDLLLITDNGKADGKLAGLITPADVVGV